MEAARAPEKAWVQRPVFAALLRVVIFLLPMAAAIVFISLANRIVPRPAGLIPTVGWFVVLTAGVMVVVHVGDRLLRHLLPIVALFRLSLVFPDRAPSRFKMAMRKNTVRQLQRDVADGTLDQQTPQEAAEHLLLLAARLNDHDRLTRGHTERVRAYSLMIGEEMGLDEDDLAKLHWAGLIHDVGKLSVPAEILSKDGRPDDDEWAVLRNHPAMGGELVEPLRGWLGSWADAASQHHERWDGRGYPHGLSAEEISLSGRIVAVADAYDVITSARSYKPAHSAEYGRKELADNAGTQFDPHVVRAFLSIGLGRLRLVMGPMSWLTQLPVVGQTPLAPALGTAAASAAAVVAAAVGGLLGPAQAESVEAAPPGVEFVAEPFAFEPPAIDHAITEDSGTSLDLDVHFGRPDSIRLVSRPEHGVLTLDDDFTLRYEPGTDRDTTVTVLLEVCKQGTCVTTTVTISITGVNDDPTAVPDRATTDEDIPVLIDVLANDTDVDSATLTLTSVSRVGGLIGDAAEIVDGAIRYRPALNAHGTVLLDYTISDGDGGTATGRVTVDVRPVNDAPRARADGATTPYFTRTTVAVVDNDTDPDGDPLRIVSIGDVVGGTASHDGERVSFTPTLGFEGEGRLTYTIADPSGARSSAVLTVVVGAAPVRMTAFPDVATVAEDGSVLVDVTANDLAPSSGIDPASLRITVPPSGGVAVVEEARIRFAPAADLNGTMGFQYEICDLEAWCDRAGVTVIVTPVNDVPTFAMGANVTVTEDSGAAVLTAWATAISPGPADEAAQTSTFAVISDNPGLFAVAPSIGSTGRLTFTPAPNAHGSATIAVALTDSAGATSPPVTARITVTPVNDAPTFSRGADVIVIEDSGPAVLTAWATAISAGPVDEAGQTVTFAVVDDAPTLFSTPPAIDATGRLTFTPSADAYGIATITVTATDSGGASGAPITARITVTNTNDPPVAVDDSAVIAEDTSLASINVLTNDTDVDPDTLTVSAYDASTIVDGVVVDLGGGAFSYTPDADFFGTEVFTYTVADGNGGIDTGTVTFQVTAVPDAPVAVDDAFSGDEDTGLVVAAPGLLANDYDVDGEVPTVDTTPVTPPANGAVALGVDGSFTYTPDPGFSGGDQFVYRITDPGGLPSTATVELTIDDGLVAATYYLGDSGRGVDDYDLALSPPPASTPVFDADGDGDPGLTIKDTNNGLGETNPEKYQYWTLPASGTSLSLDGPVTVDLWSSIKDFDDDHEGRVQIWLHDCLGVSCTLLASTDVYHDPWNDGVADWKHREIPLGSVTTDVVAGHELRLRVQFDEKDTWVAMTVDHPSALRLTMANAAPLANDDAESPVSEDGPTTSFDPLANDLDVNLDVASVTIIAAASLGTAVPQPDGTIDYTPTTNANGAESFEYRVCDTGGLCDTATVSFTVTAVNDAPSFTGTTPVQTAQGVQSVPGWANAISAGPADESGQALTFVVTANDNPGIFNGQPTIDAGGTLSFDGRPLDGTANITVELRDDGGGTNTSTPFSFTIKISDD